MNQIIKFRRVVTLLFSISLLMSLSITSHGSLINSTQIRYNNLSFGQIHANILYVGDGALDSFPTIQSALNAAKDGDTIYVYDDSSPYYEQLAIDKSVTVMGENKETTVIDGFGSGTVVFIKGDNVVFSDFTVQNAGLSSPNSCIISNADGVALSDISISTGYYGIRLEYSHRNTISHIDISSIVNSGISLDESTDASIFSTIITDSKRGIELGGSSNYNSIYATTLLDCEIGLDVKDSFYNSIYWNTITNNEWGVIFENSDDNELFNENIIDDNTIGISLLNSDDNSIFDKNVISKNNIGIQLYSSTGTNIYQNSIYSNEYALLVNRSSNNDIYWNDVYDNYYAVYVSYARGNQIYMNNLFNNHHFAVYLLFCTQTKIVYNNFFENYIHSSFIQELSSKNSWKKNYWDDWSGSGNYKINGELVSFLPFTRWNCTDYRPSSSPYDI